MIAVANTTSTLAASQRRLEIGAVFSASAATGASVEVHEGMIWLTFSNDPVDHLLNAGESFDVVRHGTIVIQPLRAPARIRLVP